MQYIAYYRVSTAKQGASGLGLAGQRERVTAYVTNEGGKITREYTEIESGKNNKRIELDKALNHCSETGAILVIASIDRLSRNISFIATLMESKANFVACDMPEANAFTIHIFAALAQQEREMISARTKAGLRQAKQKGVILGTPSNLTPEAIVKSRLNRSESAKNNENNKRAAALINALRPSKMTLQAIADRLNKAGFTTSRGKQFTPTQVKRLAAMYEY